jgi:hypothetical protein
MQAGVRLAFRSPLSIATLFLAQSAVHSGFHRVAPDDRSFRKNFWRSRPLRSSESGFRRTL